MRIAHLNSRQRVVVVVGLGVALYVVGDWITTVTSSFGWVAYAPLSNTVSEPPGGLYPWVRLVIWLVLILIWVFASVVLLRTGSDSER
jgi:hypothetical protein